MTLSYHSPQFNAPMADFSRQALGDMLRSYVLRSSKTQRQIADEVGIAQPSYVSHMVNGRVNWVESDYFPRLAEALSLSAEEVKELRPEVIVISTPIENYAAKKMSGTDLVQVRINLVTSGTFSSMNLNQPSALVSVSEALAKRALGGLKMDREYVVGVGIGSWALWSDRMAKVGELIVVEKDGCEYPAFLVAGGMVEVDTAINATTPLRFKPDRIVGMIEEIRLLEVPRRALS